MAVSLLNVNASQPSVAWHFSQQSSAELAVGAELHSICTCMPGVR